MRNVNQKTIASFSQAIMASDACLEHLSCVRVIYIKNIYTMIIRKKTVTISSKIVLSAVLSALILTPEASAIGSVILDDSDQSNSVSIVAPADVTTNYSLTFPAALGTNGQIMTIDGSGTISFSDKISDDEVTTAKILDGNVTFAKLDAAGVVDATDTIATNDNDTTIPTTAAVIDYVDANGGPFEAGSTGTGSITSSVNKTNGGDATGNYSTASGYLSRASGDYSVAIGESPIASGASSVAMGGGGSATKPLGEGAAGYSSNLRASSSVCSAPHAAAAFPPWLDAGLSPRLRGFRLQGFCRRRFPT